MTVSRVDVETQTIHGTDGSTVVYDRLCVCTGARPKVVVRYPLVIPVRDVASVDTLRAKLASSRRVVTIGNGGVALELVHAISGLEVVWVV